MSLSAYKPLKLFFSLCLALGPLTSMAQDDHSGHGQSSGQMSHDQGQSGQGQMMQHREHMQAMRANRQAAPTTSGQSIMDVISQVVKTLQADENTDWSQIDIATLRQHLVDMDRVALAAEAEASVIDGGSSFRVTGPDARTVAAIQRMVPQHARQIERELGWTISSELTNDGVNLLVVAESAQDAQMIRALGFLGFMTLGEHHADHHLMMAGGKPTATAGAMNHGGDDQQSHAGH